MQIVPDQTAPQGLFGLHMPLLSIYCGSGAQKLKPYLIKEFHRCCLGSRLL